MKKNNDIHYLVMEQAKELEKYLRENYTFNLKNDEMEDVKFVDIFNHGKVEIEIPKIQRNYVQGNNIRIREQFVKDIFDNMINNKIMDLDIIFGIEKQEEEVSKFIPIDGQQRLTTLFLVFWYIYFISENYEEIEKMKFSYESREKTKDFFRFLRNSNKNEENNIFKQITKSEKEKIAERIKDTIGYKNSQWDNDTTVNAALNMLDEIEHYCKPLQQSDLENIINNKRNIGFKKYILNLGVDVAEDLYIKMNSRGRELSNFDKIKAILENYLQKDLNEETYKQIYINLNYYWLNLFINEEETNIETIKKAENKFYIFLKKYVIYQFIEENVKKNNLRDITVIEEENEDIIRLGEKNYQIENIEKFAEKLINVMSNIKILLLEYDNSDFIDIKKITRDILENEKYDIKEDLEFYSIIKFLEFNNAKDKKEEYYEWIRITRNYIESINHIQKEGSTENYSRTLAFIKRMADEMKKFNFNPIEVVYNIGDKLEKEGKNENNWFFETEKMKSKLIKEESMEKEIDWTRTEWRKVIIQADKDTYFKGRNYFLFEYIYGEENVELFVKYQKITEILFNNKNKDKEEYLLQRALLATDMTNESKSYFIQTREDSNVYTYLLFFNTDNTNTWLSELNKIKEVNVRKALKSLIDKYLLEESIEKINKSTIIKKLNKQIKEYNDMYNWKYYFIKNPNLFKASQMGNIMFERNKMEEKIFILNRTRRSSTQWDYITYFLYNKLKSEMEDEMLTINYNGKFGSNALFDNDTTLKLKINKNNCEYDFFREKNTNSTIILKENNKEIFRMNYKIEKKSDRSNNEEFTKKDKNHIMKELNKNSEKITIEII